MMAVVRETGLTPDTLRIWEHRYGVPNPKRTPGGHRLYSQSDVDTLKWLIARRDEGLSISRAVDLWKQSFEHGLAPLQLNVLIGSSSHNHSDLDTLRRAWVDMCMQFNEKSAEQVLAKVFSIYPLGQACIEVIQRGLVEINDRWYRGEASIQQVYFLSELAVRRLESLLVTAPPPARAERLLLGNPPQEQHTLGMLLLALLLRWNGWDTLYLGANLPLQNLEQTLKQVEPTLVVLSAQQLHTAVYLSEAAKLIQDAGVVAAYGGRIFNILPVLRRYIPGHFLGEDLAQAPEAIGYMLREKLALPIASKASKEFVAASDCYRSQRYVFEARLQETIKELDLTDAQVAEANGHLGRNLLAALYFGDMALMTQEIFWLEGLLAYHQVPVNLLYRYLNAYYRAAKAYLGDECRPIINWLAQITGNEP